MALKETKDCNVCGGTGFTTRMVPVYEDGKIVRDGVEDIFCYQCHGRGTIDTCTCGGTYWSDRSCGADVCDKCRDHKGLARCYCGWSLSGGNGYTELIEAGETIEDDY